MQPVPAFLCSAVAIVGVASGAAILMRGALSNVLVDLCGSERRAGFWALYAALFVPLATLFGVLYSAPARNGTDLGFGMTDCAAILRAGMWGLLASLVLEAFVLMRAIARHENARLEERRLDLAPRVPLYSTPAAGPGTAASPNVPRPTA
jgi:hypothetical protein